MIQKAFFVSILVFFGLSVYAQAITDSVIAVKKPTERKSHYRITARAHSKGMFLYGGRVCSDNPAVDVNFTFNRPKWGFFVFKAVDLQDHTSPNNFMLAVLFKNFKLSNRLTFTPHIGTLLEQVHSCADTGSDIVIIGATNFKINQHLSIEHTALFPNLAVEPENLDWVNRMRILFVSKHIDVTAAFWHNNHVFDNRDYASTALTIAYSRIRLSDGFNLSLSATDLAVLNSSDEESVPKTNKFLVTAAIQFVK